MRSLVKYVNHPGVLQKRIIKLFCTIIYFVYAFRITEETSLKLLRRFKHFSGAPCLTTKVTNQKSTVFRKEKNKQPTQCLKVLLQHTWKRFFY